MTEHLNNLHEIEEIGSRLGDVSSICKLVGDASSRSYFRISYLNNSSVMAMVSPEGHTGDELIFLEVQKYLENLGLPVPKIYLHDQTAGIVILEDLGDNLLETVVSNVDLAHTRNLYHLALDTLLSLHRETSTSGSRCSAFDLAFDETKLMQEMDFFVIHYVEGWAGKTLQGKSRDNLIGFFHQICSELANEPRVFTHRDYHSRNLILKHDRMYMIDFQDARMGPAQYDLASLLRDSYVRLPEDLTQQLIVQYWEGADFLKTRDMEQFLRVFDIMSLQRNIKALGTFGYQTHVKRNNRYLSAIPITTKHISNTLPNYAEFKNYMSLIEDYIITPGSALV